MNLPLFPVEMLENRIPAPPITARYFLLAYWPAGRWWRAFTTLYDSPESAELQREAARLADKGWTHIRIMALPEQV